MSEQTTSNTLQVDKSIPTLVSYILCPFVQRSVITLSMKDVPFERVNIDLANPPAWFTRIVPTGKVPALLFDDELLFESAVINEFIDENFGDRLQEKTPLARAKERAWVNYVEGLLIDQYNMGLATDKATYEKEKTATFVKLQALSEQIGENYFSDDSFGLMDAAIAPFFMRLKLTPPIYQEMQAVVGQDSRLISWIENLTALPAVKNSVVDDFEQQYIDYFSQKGSYLFANNSSTVAA